MRDIFPITHPGSPFVAIVSFVFAIGLPYARDFLGAPYVATTAMHWLSWILFWRHLVWRINDAHDEKVRARRIR